MLYNVSVQLQILEDTPDRLAIREAARFVCASLHLFGGLLAVAAAVYTIRAEPLLSIVLVLSAWNILEVVGPAATTRTILATRADGVLKLEKRRAWSQPTEHCVPAADIEFFDEGRGTSGRCALFVRLRSRTSLQLTGYGRFGNLDDVTRRLTRFFASATTAPCAHSHTNQFP